MAPPSEVAKVYKQRLLEWALRTLHHGFVDNIGASSLPQYTSFDPSKLGGENGAYFMHEGTGLGDAMIETVYDQSKIEGLKISLAPILNDRDKQYEPVRAEIHKLLEEDLRKCDRPNCCAQTLERIDQLNLNSKLSLLVKHRMTINLKLLEPSQTSTEYQVWLFSLINGSGRCERSTKLFFSHGSPFSTFLGSLREATQQCKIPPKDLSNEIAFWTAIDAGDLNPEIGASFTSSATMANSSDQGESSQSQISLSLSSLEGAESVYPTPSTMPKAPSSSGNGYTLDHGPWSYRFARNQQIQTKWEDITDEEGFLRMLENLKELEADYTGHYVVLMHSMDKRCKSQQQELTALHDAASEKELEYYQSLDWPEEDGDDRDEVGCSIGYKNVKSDRVRGSRRPSLSFRLGNPSFTSFAGGSQG